MLSHQESGVPEDFRVYGQTSTETPWRSIYLAAGLLIAGVVLLFTGIGLWATDPDAHGRPRCAGPCSARSECPSVAHPMGLLMQCPGLPECAGSALRSKASQICCAGLVLFVLGLVIFVPGAYFSRIAYYAYKGREGYSFDAIPNV